MREPSFTPSSNSADESSKALPLRGADQGFKPSGHVGENSNSGLRIRPLLGVVLASARELVLLMLEEGHTPQFLTVHQTGAEAVAAAVQQEIQLLQQHNQGALASALQHRAGLPSSTTREATGLQHYAQGSILRARLQRLNQDRGVQKSARLGPTEEVLNTAAGLLNGMQMNTAMHLLCSHAEVCPYSPWIEQALAEAAETEEHWLGAREHWKNILRNQPPASIAVHAQGRLNDLEASEPLKQQMVVMQFDHLLFEECFLVHTGPETLPFATQMEAAKAFWQHDPEADALLSPEINPLIWADFRGDSTLQEAARYWLVQKLFHGRCLLEAIANDGGVPVETMARRCAASFNSSFYIQQRDHWTTVKTETALTHYLRQGWQQGLDPSPTFCTDAALEQEPLLRQFGINPLYATLCGINNSWENKELTPQNQIERFPESDYFNKKFTWFTASAPGDTSQLDLHVVMDDFDPEGESHTNIFQMMHQLEQQGHRLTAWVLNPNRAQHSVDIKDDAINHYQPIRAKVLELDTSFFFSSGDAVIATSRPSVDVVRKAQGFRERFYTAREDELPEAIDGLTSLSRCEWDTTSEALEQAILRRLSTLEPDRTSDGILFQKCTTYCSEQPRFKASVVLPTHNAGAMLQRVLDALSDQETPWKFQCVLIDSSSNDGTLGKLKSFAKRHANVSVHQINQKNFQHGYTRNKGIEWSNAEFVAFLTQDAIPANKYWLYNLVSALENEHNAAGCFGRHIAHDDAPQLMKQELENYFNALNQFPKKLSIHTDADAIKRGNERWRKILHFYSDNNSCLRKSIWKDIPLPCIPFGEDQLWAEMIIRRGYKKVYANNATVKHSHNYTPTETYNRANTEAEFYRICFGHTIHKTRIQMDVAISRDYNNAIKRAFQSKDRDMTQQLKMHLQCIIAKNCGSYQATRQLEGAVSSQPSKERLQFKNRIPSSRAKPDTP